MDAFDADLDEDLSALSGLFRQQGIAHRIFERGGRQVLELPDATHLEQVRASYQQLRDGTLKLELKRAPQQQSSAQAVLSIAWRFPIFFALTLTAICLYPVGPGYLGMGGLMKWLSFTTPANVLFNEPVAQLVATVQAGQLWRLITPVFLHFSLAHIGFNLAMMYEFGRRLEAVLTPGLYLLAILLIAVVSNTAQFLVAGHAFFGGLSGVVYGLFGALVVLGVRFPDVAMLQLKKPFIIMIVLFLVLFSTGITERFGLNIANSAHWGGFAVGLAFGALAPLRRRIVPDTEEASP